MPGNRLTGAYCYDLALKAVDYYGNIARNRKNRDTSNNYSPEFSPNNIRRVIICPDKVVSEFHVGVDKGKSRVKSLTVPG